MLKIRQFLDAIKIRRTHIVGHSLAGDEMTVFASLYPDRVGRLVYLDAALDRVNGGAQRLKDPFISPGEKRMWLESSGSPNVGDVVLPPAAGPMVGLFREMNTFRIDYARVQAPALALYASVPDRYPDAAPQTDPAMREKMDAWFASVGRPEMERARRSSIEHFRQQQPRARVLEMTHTPHNMFLGDSGRGRSPDTRIPVAVVCQVDLTGGRPHEHACQGAPPASLPSVPTIVRNEFDPVDACVEIKRYCS